MAARRLHGIVYGTIALCCLVIVICSVSLGTDEWFQTTTETTSVGMSVEVKFGLFKGKKTRYLASTKVGAVISLKVVCSGAKCMYSCGRDSSTRKADLDTIIAGEGQAGDRICGDDEETRALSPERQDSTTTPQPPPSQNTENIVFMNHALYLIVIIFLAFAIFFSALGGGLALYNTYRTPVSPILSIFGLYLWNGISAACTFLAMLMWIVQFAVNLRKNAAVSDTLKGFYVSKGSGSLGVSFWILILAILASLANIGILKYRSWKIERMERANVKVMTEELTSGNILLF